MAKAAIPFVGWPGTSSSAGLDLDSLLVVTATSLFHLGHGKHSKEVKKSSEIYQKMQNKLD